MSWVLAILLSVIAFALAVQMFRIGKALWTTLATALALGLVGYAAQASPGIPSAPKDAAATNPDGIYDIVAARREFISEGERSRADALYTADAYAMRGRYEEAARLLAAMTSENPQDFEAWIAQGNALVEHADGALTAPALYAYRQAATLRPDHIAPSYFLGVSLVRQGRLMEARQIWREALDAAPAGAAGREGLEVRVNRIEGMLGAMGAMEGVQPPAQGTAGTE